MLEVRTQDGQSFRVVVPRLGHDPGDRETIVEKFDACATTRLSLERAQEVYALVESLDRLDDTARPDRVARRLGGGVLNPFVPIRQVAKDALTAERCTRRSSVGTAMPMLVVFGGLPGTGQSVLAEHAAELLRCLLFSKEVIEAPDPRRGRSVGPEPCPSAGLPSGQDWRRRVNRRCLKMGKVVLVVFPV